MFMCESVLCWLMPGGSARNSRSLWVIVKPSLSGARFVSNRLRLKTNATFKDRLDEAKWTEKNVFKIPNLFYFGPRLEPNLTPQLSLIGATIRVLTLAYTKKCQTRQIVGQNDKKKGQIWDFERSVSWPAYIGSLEPNY